VRTKEDKHMKYHINYKRVTKRKAREYVDKLWGSGTMEKREQEAREYFAEESDNWCSWADGFSISY